MRTWTAQLFTVCSIATAFSSLAGSALLTATPPTQNTDGSPVVTPLTYRVYWGCSNPRQYQNSASIAAFPYTVQGLPDVGTCYFAATTVDSLARESVLSNETQKLMGVLAAPDAPAVGPTITWSAPQPVAITKGTFTEYAGADGSASSVTSSSFDSSGAGLLIAVATWEDVNSSGLTFSDNKGNTWETAIVEDGGGLSGAHSAMAWSVPTTVGTGHTVTCSFGVSAPFRRVAVLNVNGTFSSASALDASSKAHTTSATADAGSLTTSAAAILVHGVADYNGLTFTQGTGWTKDSATTGRHFQSRIEAGSGTFDPSGTLSAGGYSNANVSMAFKEAAGGGTILPQMMQNQ